MRSALTSLLSCDRLKSQFKKSPLTPFIKREVKANLSGSGTTSMGIFLPGAIWFFTVFRLAEIFLPARSSWSFFCLKKPLVF